MLKRTTYPTQREPLRKRAASHDEFGKAEKKLVVCTRCHQARIGKKWRTAASLLAKNLTAHKEGVHFTLCPACTMITKKLYEGEIVINGVPPSRETELLHMIVSFGARAQEIDPQDRISAIEHTKKGQIRVTTTENQLAQKIAKKIKSAFKKTSIDITRSKEPFQVTRIQVQLPS
ncbi:MAG: hypothetical protein ACYCZ7_00840 [Minisyncoccota bacterium]